MKRACLFLIRFYQAASAGLRPRCRFWPSCSSYAYEAIETHGLGRGAWLAIKRISRCRPGGGAGVDLVPAKLDAEPAQALPARPAERREMSPL